MVEEVADNKRCTPGTVPSTYLMLKTWQVSFPLGCRTMKEGAWSGPWLYPGSLTQSLALVGTYFCVFINYLFGRVTHSYINSFMQHKFIVDLLC